MLGEAEQFPWSHEFNFSLFSSCLLLKKKQFFRGRTLYIFFKKKFPVATYHAENCMRFLKDLCCFFIYPSFPNAPFLYPLKFSTPVHWEQVG